MCSHKCESSDAADYNIGILANGTIEFAFKLCPLSLWERESGFCFCFCFLFRLHFHFHICPIEKRRLKDDEGDLAAPWAQCICSFGHEKASQLRRVIR